MAEHLHTPIVRNNYSLVSIVIYQRKTLKVKNMVSKLLPNCAITIQFTTTMWIV